MLVENFWVWSWGLPISDFVSICLIFSGKDVGVPSKTGGSSYAFLYSFVFHLIVHSRHCAKQTIKANQFIIIYLVTTAHFDQVQWTLWFLKLCFVNKSPYASHGSNTLIKMHSKVPEFLTSYTYTNPFISRIFNYIAVNQFLPSHHTRASANRVVVGMSLRETLIQWSMWNWE